MKCPVCGFEIAEGEAECSVCGFMSIVQLGDSEEAKQQLKEMAAQYRKQICGDYEIGITAYSNTVRNNKVVVEKTDYIALGRGNALSKEIKWYPEAFVRPKSNKLTFTFYVKKEGGPKVTHRRTLTLKPANDDIHIGIIGGGDGIFYFCVGSASEYAMTEQLNVFSASIYKK